MIIVAKILQILGIFEVGFAVIEGIREELTMWQELILSLIGLAIFTVGWVLEKKFAKRLK